MQKINREKALLGRDVQDWKELDARLNDTFVLLEMAVEAEDETTFQEAKSELTQLQEKADTIETKSLLSDPRDGNGCYLSINAGAGGTEACDWAEMLLRMYTRYAESHGFKTEIIALSEGEEAGIKSATIAIEGPYAYGHLKAENGVHRLVRISPFDSNARRHTSFASVFSWPELEEDIQIEVRDEDIRVDTFRASGAGGQHVNRTDSAVRITHIATGIVVQCQNQRSQHANRDKAMKMLKAQLYERELEKRRQEMDQLSAGKLANEWGSQIRSYVLHPYQLVKDHRTEYESMTPQLILDGQLDGFIKSFLKSKALARKSEAN